MDDPHLHEESAAVCIRTGGFPRFFLRNAFIYQNPLYGISSEFIIQACFLTFNENCFGVMPKNSLKLRIK